MTAYLEGVSGRHPAGQTPQAHIPLGTHTHGHTPLWIHTPMGTHTPGLTPLPLYDTPSIPYPLYTKPICEQKHTCKNITFPHTSYVVGKYVTLKILQLSQQFKFETNIPSVKSEDFTPYFVNKTGMMQRTFLLAIELMVLLSQFTMSEEVQRKDFQEKCV